jgi:quinol monooxygenase YgiN
MALMIIHHRVRDYTTWRPVFDAHEPIRIAAGLSNAGVFRSADDPDDLFLLFEFADRQKAEAFAASDELKTAMQRAGVEGTPEMHFTEARTPATA